MGWAAGSSACELPPFTLWLFSQVPINSKQSVDGTSRALRLPVWQRADEGHGGVKGYETACCCWKTHTRSHERGHSPQNMPETRWFHHTYIWVLLYIQPWGSWPNFKESFMPKRFYIRRTVLNYRISVSCLTGFHFCYFNWLSQHQMHLFILLIISFYTSTMWVFWQHTSSANITFTPCMKGFSALIFHRCYRHFFARLLNWDTRNCWGLFQYETLAKVSVFLPI